MTGNCLITIGLIVDIGGALWLYRHAIKLTKKEADDLAATKWNGNEQLKQFFLFHARDVRIGLSMLVLGFLIQIAGIWIK